MSKQIFTESIVRRLAFIKYLYNVAVEQSRMQEPFAAASILTFHDSIELFLQLACEYLDAPTKTNTQFIEYWEILKTKVPNGGITQKESIARLNKSRVALKHHGILPTKLDIETYRASSINFFEDNTPLVFGTKIEDISMINLVVYESVKDRLKRAEIIKQSNLTQALVEVAIAFEELINGYEKSKRSQLGHFSSFAEEITLDDSFSMGIRGLDDYRFSNFIDEVGNSIRKMRNAINILTLGLDYKRYIKFNLLTPEIFERNGEYGHRILRNKKPSKEEYNFCFDFVIDSSIRLQDFDLEGIDLSE